MFYLELLPFFPSLISKIINLVAKLNNSSYLCKDFRKKMP
ncbi:hypothetical protein PREVCOP_04423 [Segatella copri DSM 18205]|uniref:Uncharacterized protein n=1 Tax=Segatella copri DSM 18205 TaxID=537011 RepID=D1PB46_9BACT|nr:hypothetical protein PREVCOP_04423 [Segatella copri DSM 18205]